MNSSEQSINNYISNDIAFGKEVLELDNVIVIVLSIDGEIQFFNKAAEIITGYSRTELLGKNWFETIVPKEIYRNLFDEFNQNISRGVIASYEGSILTKKGEVRFINWKNSSLISENGINGVITFGFDITDRINLEEKLKNINTKLETTVFEKAEEYKNILDRITDGVAAVDSDWNYLYINNKGADLLNVDMEKLIGSNLWEYFPDAAKLPVGDAMKSAMKEQHYVFSENYYAPLDRWYENHFFPSQKGMTNIFKDITQKKKTDEALKYSEENFKILTGEISRNNEKFKLLIENSRDAISLLNQNGELIYLSPAGERMTGFTFQEIKDKKIFDFLHPEGSQEAKEFFEKLFNEPGVTLNETSRVLHKDGYYIWIECNVTNLLHDENLKAIISNFRDVTERINSEKALEKSEQKFRMLIENSHDAVSLFNEKGEITYLSPAGERITGYKSEEVIGKNIFDFFHPEGALIAREVFEKLYKEPGKTVNRTNRLLHKNGNYIRVESNVTNLLQDENVKAIISNFRDITERIRAEEALEKSELNYKTLIEQAPDGVFISGIGQLIHEVNESGCKLLGYKLSELQKMEFADLIDPENLKSIPLKTNELITGKNIVIERILVRKNKKKIPVEISSKMLSDGRFQSFVRDISNRKKIESELQKTELQNKLLVEQAPDGIFISDAQHFMKEVNASGCKMLGYSLSELQQMKFMDVISPENLKNHPVNFTGLKSGNTVMSERILVRKDGFEIPVEISAKLLSDGRFQSFVRDISERKKIKEELREKNLKLRNLTAYIQNAREEERKYIAREIHDELGQMLTGIKIDISWLGKKLTPSKTNLLKKIDELLEMTDKTINSVRRIATELRPGILDDLGLEEAIIWQVNEFQTRTGIECKLEGKLTNPKFDPMLSITAFRILQEALTNVTRHSQATSVLVKIDDSSENLSLEIIDNGTGIAFNEMKVKKSLGLLGMKERAAIIGGMLNISSGANSGTTVNIVIPIKNKQLDDF